MDKKVLVVGANGYIGSVLIGMLQKKFDVIGLDTGFYSDVLLYNPKQELTNTIIKDIRRVSIGDIKGMWAVICLSDLTDPTSSFIPNIGCNP